SESATSRSRISAAPRALCFEGLSSVIVPILRSRDLLISVFSSTASLTGSSTRAIVIPLQRHVAFEGVLWIKRPSGKPQHPTKRNQHAGCRMGFESPAIKLSLGEAKMFLMLAD